MTHCYMTFTILKRRLAHYLRTPIHNLVSPQTDVSLLCWVRSVRKHKDIIFVDLSDGLSSHRLQAVIHASLWDPKKAPISAGCSVRISGDLVQSPGQNQQLELVTKELDLVGECDAAKYPFRPRKTYNIDLERNFQHLRPRMEKYAAVHRVRNRLTQAAHAYFQELDFCQIQTPILTTNDCEGAGETFLVNHIDDLKPTSPSPPTPPSSLEKVAPKSPAPPPTYFPSQCHLTVSSQLHLEALVHSISRVYTIQSAFRAENALSRKHLCEFTMLEVELVTESVDTIVSITEELIKRMWLSVREMEDFKTLGEDWRDAVDTALAKTFVRISYDDAVKELQGKQLTHPLTWGCDFKVEHENLLLEFSQGRPLVITHFPAKIKPFYMATKDGEHGRLAECFDLLLPVGGEVVGGSMREMDRDKLLESIQQASIKGLEWYVELREFGSVPHGGFGLGVDRLLQYFTNTHNIKETVPFPRWQKHCQA
ncbi:putative asparagine--tRNA ligase [Tropilaelaps mercedesae]|uniref:asparagine--tRNA ligase n=1 Tax=Tropilaelaps mercedesae TaxID=418985 RepID=A0A1V9XFV6_9ACAR|nr:putative asparagine--tRNA ligase [Tropilaelaps mercedesae]